jgi:hypothetical protein
VCVCVCVCVYIYVCVCAYVCRKLPANHAPGDWPYGTIRRPQTCWQLAAKGAAAQRHQHPQRPPAPLSTATSATTTYISITSQRASKIRRHHQSPGPTSYPAPCAPQNHAIGLGIPGWTHRAQRAQRSCMWSFDLYCGVGCGVTEVSNAVVPDVGFLINAADLHC